jgi:hypothetical protein
MNDVAMEILYCGVCHSDLHTARNDWGWSYLPDRSRSRNRRPRDRSRAGSDALQGRGPRRRRLHGRQLPDCDQCHKGEEQLCREGMTGTYAGGSRHRRKHTHGGYSKHLVVREEFCLRVPRRPRPGARGSACCAPGSPPIRRCAPGMSARQPRRRDRPWRPWPHGSQAGGRPGRRRHGAEPHEGQGKRRVGIGCRPLACIRDDAAMASAAATPST